MLVFALGQRFDHSDHLKSCLKMQPAVRTVEKIIDFHGDVRSKTGLVIAIQPQITRFFYEV